MQQPSEHIVEKGLVICADEDREEIQGETEKQEEAFDQIGSALGDLKHMSHVGVPLFPE